ncbi:MAG: hypothetical protein MUF51_07340, partial [Vicinamibacteria bacterium]|nr:hypothetical protein [Vicinamibacteria bacterium]
MDLRTPNLGTRGFDAWADLSQQMRPARVGCLDFFQRRGSDPHIPRAQTYLLLSPDRRFILGADFPSGAVGQDSASIDPHKRIAQALGGQEVMADEQDGCAGALGEGFHARETLGLEVEIARAQYF